MTPDHKGQPLRRQSEELWWTQTPAVPASFYWFIQFSVGSYYFLLVSPCSYWFFLVSTGFSWFLLIPTASFCFLVSAHFYWFVSAPTVSIINFYCFVLVSTGCYCFLLWIKWSTRLLESILLLILLLLLAAAHHRWRSFQPPVAHQRRSCSWSHMDPRAR